MIRRLLAVAAAGVLLLAITASGEQSAVRGVRLRDLPRYSQPTFTCFDGSQSLPSARVNDDYCDCADGSDEPGTSACVNSRFYCRNLGAKGRSLPSSRVNDGICDCCDGTDELAEYSGITCHNVCAETGRAAREEAEREIANTEAGVQVRQTMIEKAQTALTEKKAKMAHYEKLMAERKALLDAARIRKEAEEATEKEEREKREAEKQRIQAEKEVAEAEKNKAAAEQAAAAGGEATAPAADAAAPAEPAAMETPVAEAQAPAAAETAAVETAAAATETAAPAETKPAENFPYPAEYAYKAADDADAAAAAAAAKPAENFPYPPEYAYKADEVEGETVLPGHMTTPDDDSVEPEYSDADDDDDDDGEGAGTATHAEHKEVEAEYVHPGQGEGKGADNKKEIGDVDAATAAPSTAESTTNRMLTLAFWQSHWAAFSAYTAQLLHDGSSNVVSVATGDFSWDRVGRRWRRRTAGFFHSCGQAVVRAGQAVASLVSPSKIKSRPTPTETPTPATGADGAWTSPEAESARASYDALETKVNRLQRKMDELKKSLDRDYGSDGQFSHMDGQCFSLQIKQYTYEVCPYSNAAQKEGSGSTSLGQWDGLVRADDGAYTMKFARGQTCWQGPQRSLTVHLRCGAEDKPVAVEEPSKCVYEMTMETPAVCNIEHAQALKLNLEGGDQEEEEEEEGQH